MAIVAIPCSAREAARASESPPTPPPPPPPCLLPPTPWPKIATGHPPAGLGPEGKYRLKNTSLTPCTTGVPVLVPTGGVKCPPGSEARATYLREATLPARP